MLKSKEKNIEIYMKRRQQRKKLSELGGKKKKKKKKKESYGPEFKNWNFFPFLFIFKIFWKTRKYTSLEKKKKKKKKKKKNIYIYKKLKLKN